MATDVKTPIPTDPPPAYDAAAQGPSRPMRPLLDLPALNELRNKRVILASASPRRRALLAQIGLTKIEVVPSKFAEDLDKASCTPFEYVSQTAHEKCRSVYEAEMDKDPGIVIAADTIIVTRDGRVLEKPRSRADHVAMLRVLRDQREHKVFTAVVAMAPKEDLTFPGYHIASHVEETTVKFDSRATNELIESYVKTGEGIDKAGGYAIQGLGSVLIEGIVGSYDNVVGLPLRGTLQVIEKVMCAEEDEEEDGLEEEE